jgi:internalin A
VSAEFVIEDRPEGRTLVVTGRWGKAAEAAVERPDVDGVWLNYARGYSEPDLSFVDTWPIRRLSLIDRSLTDLSPLERLGDALEQLSVQASPTARLDLAAFPQLRAVFGPWDLICDTVDGPTHLERLGTSDYDGTDLAPLAVQPGLQHVTLKVARELETLDGAEKLPTLTSLWFQAVHRLTSLDALTSAAPTLRKFELEGCRRLTEIEPIAALTELRVLGLSDCGELPSFAPLASLARLETLYAWGTTRVADADLLPLLGLTRLREIRMRDRPRYQPSLSDLKARIGCE